MLEDPWGVEEEQVREERSYWRRVLLVSLVGALIMFATAGAIRKAFAEAPSKPFIVEVIEISGTIGDGSGSQMARSVETINENPRVKAVLLVVNTPGGGAVASAALYEELTKLKVPVVGWCDHLCASGGMYALMSPSVKWIGVRRETIAGSIGVIGQIARYNRLLEWAKIDMETYVSGPLKDAGNSTRLGRDDERKYIQSIISDLATRFYEVVGKSRKITDWGEVKTGRIFIGAEAVRVGLADAVMTREEAIAKAKELSGQKLIFTRDEMKKMSQSADEHPVYHAPSWQPQSQFGDVAALVEMAKEIRQGEVIRFDYRMPMKF